MRLSVYQQLKEFLILKLQVTNGDIYVGIMIVIEKDYWTPITPLFNDRMFERTFRVSKQIANIILQVAGSSDPFFTDRVDGLGKAGICPKVKILKGLN